jgi:SAM-dependent methyltransferase
MEERARSFGTVAEDYDRWRPGPSPAVVDWLLPATARRVVDLGAETGALSRLLVERADEVVSLDPDPRMREVLARQVPGATVLEGRGERLPVDDASVDAILVSSAWHWMDVEPTLLEAARALRDGGVLGVVWSGPDWAGRWEQQLREVVERDPSYAGLLTALADQVVTDDNRKLEVPSGLPFTSPEHTVIDWSLTLSADQLVGIVGTLSSVILLGPARRDELLNDARRLLRDHLGLAGAATTDLGFRADCWRATRLER